MYTTQTLWSGVAYTGRLQITAVRCNVHAFCVGSESCALQTRYALARGCELRSGLDEGEDGEHAAAAVCGLGQAEFHEDGAHV